MMSSKPLLNARVIETAAGAHVVAAAALETCFAFALADGTVGFADESGGWRRTVAHENGTILAAASDSRRIFTGGDDGRVTAVDSQGGREEIADEGGKWIDALAVRADGALAWSVGKHVKTRDYRKELRSMTAPSSVRGLCFLPKGFRLAFACYNGVSLWFPNVAAEPETLEWRGSHLGVTVSPDGRFVVSSMQENALHGWRVADRKNMRMTGYPSKTRSFSWSSDGHWLATSGAEACIVWPFATKDGPMGRGPEEVGVRSARVTQVAFHPKAATIAVGYDDGWILLCRMDNREEAAVRVVPDHERKSAISALAWNSAGDRLLYGTAAGLAGVAALPL